MHGLLPQETPPLMRSRVGNSTMFDGLGEDNQGHMEDPEHLRIGRQ